MSKPGKNSIGFIKLQIPAGSATPAPPVGPALGQKGLNIMEFCKSFNDKTKTYEKGTPIRVRIQAFADRTFDFEILGSPVSHLIKKELGITKGSTAPGRNMIGTITMDQLKKVAKAKMEEGLSARDEKQAMKIVAGSARAMGLKVVGDWND